MLPFERLEAWKVCHQLVLAVYRASEEFPKHELYGLTSQSRRAAFSAAANLAEGSAKRGPAEFRRYADITVGSLAEVAYALMVARDLGMLSAEAWAGLDKLRGRAGFLTFRLCASLDRAAKHPNGKRR